VGGIVGSLFGILAGILSFLNVILEIEFTEPLFITTSIIWALFYLIQGSTFFQLYIQADSKSALTAFIFGIISAVFIIIIESLIHFITDGPYLYPIIGLPIILALLIALVGGIITEPCYLILVGVTMIFIAKEKQEGSFVLATGALFILCGGLLILGTFVEIYLVHIPLVITNILAIKVFLSEELTRFDQHGLKVPTYGLEIQ
jgi:hypothetical protein